MKRLVFIAALMALPLFAQTFSASAGFSSTQGQNGWSYIDGQGVPMTYVAASAQWKGTETYNLIWRTGQHPGSASDAIRRWKAPSGGSVLITGKAYDENPNCGNGVSVLVKKNGAILWQDTIANKDAVGKSFSMTAAVLAGDTIDFVVQGIGGDNSCDSTFLDPTIVLSTAPLPPPDPGPTPTPIPPPDTTPIPPTSTYDPTLIPCSPLRRKPLGPDDACVCGERWEDPPPVTGDPAPRPGYAFECKFNERASKWSWRNWLLENVWHPPQ